MHVQMAVQEPCVQGLAEPLHQNDAKILQNSVWSKLLRSGNEATKHSIMTYLWINLLIQTQVETIVLLRGASPAEQNGLQ